ncbi:4177_t:CDS:2, partial [Paraglomus occultum]
LNGETRLFLQLVIREILHLYLKIHRARNIRTVCNTALKSTADEATLAKTVSTTVIRTMHAKLLQTATDYDEIAVARSAETGAQSMTLTSGMCPQFGLRRLNEDTSQEKFANGEVGSKKTDELE